MALSLERSCISPPFRSPPGAETETPTHFSRDCMVGIQTDVDAPARPEWSPPLDDAAAGTWFVASVRINMERRAAQSFLARSIDFYCPFVDRVVVSGGKRRVVPTPAFSRYAFVRGDEHTPGDALATRLLLG